MTDPLTSLDELIWKQFEKVTQYAQKNYGWDKWDLAYCSTTASYFSFFGYGIYLTLLGAHRNDFTQGFLESAVGITSTVGSVMFQRNVKDEYRKKKETELRHLAWRSASEKPEFHPYRPINIGSVMLGAGVGIYSLFYDESFNQGKTTAYGLTMITTAMMFSFKIAANYFSDQLMTPPSPRKPFWKTTYENIRHKFKPRPQLEPSAEPASQYATIDTLIG